MDIAHETIVFRTAARPDDWSPPRRRCKVMRQAAVPSAVALQIRRNNTALCASDHSETITGASRVGRQLRTTPDAAVDWTKRS